MDILDDGPIETTIDVFEALRKKYPRVSDAALATLVLAAQVGELGMTIDGRLEEIGDVLSSQLEKIYSEI